MIARVIAAAQSRPSKVMQANPIKVQIIIKETNQGGDPPQILR
jgi:hypothetical protein